MKYILWFHIFIFLSFFPLVGNAAGFSVIRPSSQAIDQAVISASEKTKIRAAVLYGLLGQETGYGGYLGKTESGWNFFCSARNTSDCQNWKNYDCHTDYRNARHLDEILAHLGYEKKDILTSSTCALGFSQFEPNTWWEVLGGNLQGLNPWNINDAVLIAAYYLENLGADKTKIPQVDDIFSTADRIALQKYYCGGNYDRPECASYAKSVENKARRAAPELLARDYEQQLATLEEQRSAIRKRLNLPEAPRIEVPKVKIKRQPVIKPVKEIKPSELPAPPVIPREPLNILPLRFWSGRVGLPYEELLQYVGGGDPPYNWSLVSGALPPGLSLNNKIVAPNNVTTGVVSGVPIAGGSFNFTLKVTDNRGTNVSRDGHIKIKPALEQPISIKGRMLDRFNKNPLVRVMLRTITPELEEYENEDIYVYSDQDGRFVTVADGLKVTAAENIYIMHHADCHDGGNHILMRDSDGKLRVRVSIPDFMSGDINNITTKEFEITGSEVDVGDILLWPTVQQLIVYSDIKVTAELQFQERDLGGNLNFKNEHYLSETIRLSIPMRVKLTDQAENIYYSPLITLPLDYGCKPVTLQFLGGQFKWEREP